MVGQFMEQRLSIVTLGVDDVAAAREFLEQQLGWRPAGGEAGAIAFYQIGSMAFAIYGLDALAEDAGISRREIGFSSVTLAYNTRSRGEVDTVYDKIIAAGAQPVKPPQAVFWGGYSSYVRILGHHLLEIAHNPFFPIDDNGGLHLPPPQEGSGDVS